MARRSVREPTTAEGGFPRKASIDWTGCAWLTGTVAGHGRLAAVDVRLVGSLAFRGPGGIDALLETPRRVESIPLRSPFLPDRDHPDTVNWLPVNRVALVVALLGRLPQVAGIGDATGRDDQGYAPVRSRRAGSRADHCWNRPTRSSSTFTGPRTILCDCLTRVAYIGLIAAVNRICGRGIRMTRVGADGPGGRAGEAA